MHASRVRQAHRVDGRGLCRRHRREVKATGRPNPGPRDRFQLLRTNQIKLNPEKCVFGVPRGMLLGYIISQRGIEANPEKVSAITRMGPI